MDIGGNVRFLTTDSTNEIYDALVELLENPIKLTKMREIAENNGMRYFSYNEIARRCIES